MTSNAAIAQDPAPMRACTVSRNVQNFDLLIEDMEQELGEAWGDLSFGDARVFLEQPDAEDIEFIAIAMDEEDEPNVQQVADLMKVAARNDVGVIVIADDVSPMVLHQLLKLGASEFVPYPLPEGALRDAIARLDEPDAPPAAANEAIANAKKTHPALAKPTRDGVILPVHGLGGGVGATTFAVNLANELSLLGKKDTKPPRVCLVDLDLQLGAVSSYLDLPQREAVFELLANTSSMDSDALKQALVTYDDRLHVLTAPPEMLPLDIIGPEDIEILIDITKSQFDYVVIDMPSTVVQWTETVLTRAHVYFALMEIDMRSAQNALRMIRALKAEDLPHEKLRFAMNRAPKFTDLSGKSRMKRLQESLGVSIELELPDGGKQVVEGNDAGTPLSDAARKNPLRKEIAKLAASVHELNTDAAEA